MTFRTLLQERALVIGLFLLAFLALVFFLLPPSPDYKLELERNNFWSSKVHGSEKYDIVIVGDSRVYRGVSPEVMERIITRARIFNFGFSSAQLETTLLDAAVRRLDPSGRRIIVLGITANSLTGQENLHYLGILRRSRDSVLADTKFFQIRLALRNFDINDIATIFPWSDSKNHISTNYIETYHPESGWVASSYRIETGFAKTLKSYRDNMVQHPVSADSISNLIKWIVNKRAEGYLVVVTSVPSSTEMEDLEALWPGYSKKDLVSKFEMCGIPYIDNYNNADYHSYDGSHLEEHGAERFSYDLATRLMPIIGLNATAELSDDSSYRRSE